MTLVHVLLIGSSMISSHVMVYVNQEIKYVKVGTSENIFIQLVLVTYTTSTLLSRLF